MQGFQSGASRVATIASPKNTVAEAMPLPQAEQVESYGDPYTSLSASGGLDGIQVGASSSLAEEIATVYSEGDTSGTIDMLRTHINENQGAVDKRFWFMLLDAYQVTGSRADFEKVALSFSSFFGISPPSWVDHGSREKGVLGGKNILILEPIFKMAHTERFREFVRASKDEKFCRINVSPCKFDQSDVGALAAFYKLMTDIRKARITAVLMGDNNLMAFCRAYIQKSDGSGPVQKVVILKPEIQAVEKMLWMIYLEVLQWKGRVEEFESMAMEFALKFDISPPGWEADGVMSLSKGRDSAPTETVLDAVISGNNVDALIDQIRQEVEGSDSGVCSINFARIDRMDFSAAGSLVHFLQTVSQNQGRIVFENVNEMICVLLEIVGVTEYITVIPRLR